MSTRVLLDRRRSGLHVTLVARAPRGLSLPQRVPQAGGSRPPPGVGPAALVVPPSAAPRDAPRGAASDGPYDASRAVGGRGCLGRWSHRVCRAAVSCGLRGPCADGWSQRTARAPRRSPMARVRDGWVMASSGCLSIHLVRVAYADLLHTSSVEDLNGGHGTPSGGLRAHRAGSGLVS
jgi:hypothetical protein